MDFIWVMIPLIMPVSRCLTIIILVTCSCNLPAQETGAYSGSFEVAGYKGVADYDFTVVENNDTILNGAFDMHQVNPRSLLNEGDSYFRFKGVFANDVAMGKWQFRFGEYKASSQSGISDYAYEIKVNGIDDEAEGEIIDGKPHGKWTYLSRHLKQSEIQETLFKSVIEFDNGIPQSSFTIEDTEMTLLGRFLRNGLAHDVWELYTNDFPVVSEKWHFNDGVLNKIIFSEGDEIDTLLMYDETFDEGKVINLDRKYIQILKLIERANKSPLSDWESKMNRLLEENVTYYKKLDDILSGLGKSDFHADFKVKVEFYPLNDKDQKLIDSTRLLLKESETLSRSILDNAQLNIMRLSDDDIAFSHAVVRDISKKLLKPIYKVIEMDQSELIEFVSKDDLTTILWDKDQPDGQLDITYNIQSKEKVKSFKGSNRNELNVNAEAILYEFQLAQYAFQNLDSIFNSLGKRLTLKKRHDELVVLEEELSNKMNKFEYVFDSLSMKSDDDTKSILTTISSKIGQSASDYSDMKEVASKSDKARSLISCVSQTTELLKTTAQLPGRGEEIKATYMDKVWNPFTATLMNEDVKKRITAAYFDVLIPHLVNSMNSADICSEAKKYESLLNIIHKRMLELRNEDTSKIERKLRRESNPEAIMRLFNIGIEETQNNL